MGFIIQVTGFIIQNGNAYEEGLKEFWDPIRAYWADKSDENGDALRICRHRHRGTAVE